MEISLKVSRREDGRLQTTEIGRDVTDRSVGIWKTLSGVMSGVAKDARYKAAKKVNWFYGKGVLA